MAITTGSVFGFPILLVIGLPLPTADAQQVPAASANSEFGRVRSSHPRLAALISEARERSHTFRALMMSIEATDGIVFVDEGRCPHRAAACLTWHVTLAGSYRMLFVRVDMRKSDLDLMASAGHELQHALEVLANASLRSSAEIQLFYKRGFSPESPQNAETAAAKAAGDAVFREVKRSRAVDGKK
jgi:hypothetical protein